MRRSGARFLAALAGLALLAGCADGDDVVLPVERGPGGELFDRYVSMGNSITAGFQSAGINDSTQLRAYPALLAAQAGATFQLPLINKPGCPPPFAVPLGPQRVYGAPPTACALRNSSAPGVVQNVAVPGARLVDALSPNANPDPNATFNRLQFFFLGGQSMIQAAARAEPTLVSVWLGNNDVLGAALSGHTALLTPEAQFGTAVEGLGAGLRAIPTLKEAVILGVVDAGVIPLLQPGAYFFLSRDAQGRFGGKPVSATCSPVTATGQPNPAAFNLVSFEMVGSAAFPEINCSNEAYPVGDPRRGTYVLTPAEQQAVSARAAAFNARLKKLADDNGWIYRDPNALLAKFIGERDAQGRFQRIRKCQALPAALQTGNPRAIQGAIVTSCPVPATGATAPFAAPNFFGSLISFDGFHPSTEAHTLVANDLIDALNSAHGTSIPRIQ